MSNKHIKLYEGWLEDMGSAIKSWFSGGDEGSGSPDAAPTSSSARSTAMSTEFMQDTKNSIKDISDLSVARRDIPMTDSRKYFIIHHTGGHGTAEGVVHVLNTRKNKFGQTMKLAVQWVVDRDGKIYRTFPEGLSAGHAGVKDGERKAGAPTDQQNRNSQGVEVVAKNDADILPVQAEAVRRLIKYLGFKLENIYGHGEVTTNKEADEGATIKKWVTKYWNAPFLPVEETIAKLKGVTSFSDPEVQDFVANLDKPSSTSNLA